MEYTPCFAPKSLIVKLSGNLNSIWIYLNDSFEVGIDLILS